jgi:hypothetical protein
MFVGQGEPSRVSGTVSADPGYVLKGAPFTLATATVVPTVYARFSEPERTGVILKWNAERRGSQYTPDTMSATGSDLSRAGFGATLQIESFGATLAIVITEKQSWPDCRSALGYSLRYLEHWQNERCFGASSVLFASAG